MPRRSSLALVRQVQALAEDVELVREEGCLKQLASILDHNLDDPDCHTRHAAAGALATLLRRCTTDEWKSLELPTAQRLMTQSRPVPVEQVGSYDYESLHEFLVSVTQGSTQSHSEQSNGQLKAGEERGEVRMEIVGSRGSPRILSQEVRSALLKAVVNVEGAVSATWENEELVVVTLAKSVACSNRFLGDIYQTVRDHAGEDSQVIHPVQPAARTVPTESQAADDEDDPVYLDDIESIGNSSDEEPTYLDDDEEEGDEQGSARRVPLFERHAWLLVGRRLQEFDDDPTLVARLRKARQKMEKKKREEQSRVQRLFSIMTPLRVLAGARRCTSDSTATNPVQHD